MKNIILSLLTVIFSSSLGLCQLKVESSGRISVRGVSSQSGFAMTVGGDLGGIYVTKNANSTKHAILADSPSSTTAFQSTFESLKLNNSDQTNNNWVRLGFGDSAFGAAAAIGSNISDHALNLGKLSFFTRDPNNTSLFAERMSIIENGNVGLSELAPSERLHVNGNIFATGMVTPSDNRLKINVKKFDDGLNVILKLKTFKYNYSGLANLESETEHIGVMAQQLKEVAPYLVKNYTHIEYADEDLDMNKVKEENYLAIKSGQIKFLLINAIKDQQEIIDNQNNRIEELEEKIDNIISLLENGDSQDLTINGSDDVHLRQNVPNPFNEITNISYQLPRNYSKAELIFFDLRGSVIEKKLLSGNGKGNIELRINDMPNGIYSYQLIVDSIVVDTKKMVLSK